MTGFVIGLMTGGMLGVIVMALLCAASREDDRMEQFRTHRE